MRALLDTELGLVSGAGSTSNNGFDSTSGQGNLRNDNVKYNSGTVTETGPQGVLKNSNYDNPNYTISGPGNSR